MIGRARKPKRCGVKGCNKSKGIVIIFITALLLAGCGLNAADRDNLMSENFDQPSPVEQIHPRERDVYDLVLLGARQEVKKGVTYDDSYQNIDYPGGDVPEDRGACTDVVIRAFRYAGIDLQQLIHEDMRENFSLYSQNWGLERPDPNIDHRRVPNQVKFFSRYGSSLTISTEPEDLPEWQWGDVVYWRFPNGLEHCGIISDRKNTAGIPLVIHNAGVAKEEDCLNRWEITGHYRYPAG
jgi:hypothetical protein